MNFSNFIIDKLTETASPLALGNKKTSSNPFLFSDIIKVCEQENDTKIVQASDSFSLVQTQEVFSTSDNVVNIKESEFECLLKQMSELFNADSEIEPSETIHKVDNADITKLQFVVSEEKLVELAAAFEAKTGYSLIPISNVSEASYNTKQLTVSYKNELNKITISINPIQVDETYTSKVIQDDFNFVNKLLVNEGLINNQSYRTVNSSTLIAESSLKDADINLLADTTDDEIVADNSSKRIFYKAEIIKIESLLKVDENHFSLIVNSNPANLGVATLDMRTIQVGVKENENFKSIDDVYSRTSSAEEKAENSNNGLTGLISTKKNPVEYVSSIDLSSDSVNLYQSTNANFSASKVEGKFTDAIKTTIAENTSEYEGSLYIKTSNDSSVKYDINKLMEGLTEEEKSVFKNFQASNEIGDIVYAKTNENIFENSINIANSEKETIKKGVKPLSIEVHTESDPVLANDKTPLTLTVEKDKSKSLNILKDHTKVIENSTNEIYDLGEVAEKLVDGKVKTPLTLTVEKDKSKSLNILKDHTKVIENSTTEIYDLGEVAEKLVDGKVKTPLTLTVEKDKSKSLNILKDHTKVIENSTTEFYDLEEVAEKQVYGKVKTNSVPNENEKVEVKQAIPNTEITSAQTKESFIQKKSKLVSKEEFFLSEIRSSQKQNYAENKVDIADTNDLAPIEDNTNSQTTSDTNLKAQQSNSPDQLKYTSAKEQSFEIFLDSKLQLNTKPKTVYKIETSLENTNELRTELQNKTNSVKVKADIDNIIPNDIKIALNQTIEEKSNLAPKVSTEKHSQTEINNEKHNNSVEVKQTNQNEVVQPKESKVNPSNIVDLNRSENTFAQVIEKEILSSSIKEKSVNTKNETDVKENVSVETKKIVVEAEQQQYGQSEKDNSKSNSSESFKSQLNQTISTEKGFEIESLKPHAESKQATETFKTIKQQEIFPELTKMVLHGEKRTMTLQLTPENLGKVKLTVDMVDNQIVTKIEVENEQVKQFVQSNLDQLKQNMQSAGMTLTNVNVSLSDEQKNQKMFTQKKKSLSREGKEEIIDEVTQLNSKKRMGYNTYEFTA